MSRGGRKGGRGASVPIWGAEVPIWGAKAPVGGAKVPVGGGDVPITGSVGLLVVPVAHMGSLHPLHGGKLNHSETILKSTHWKHLKYI